MTNVSTYLGPEVQHNTLIQGPCVIEQVTLRWFWLIGKVQPNNPCWFTLILPCFFHTRGDNLIFHTKEFIRIIRRQMKTLQTTKKKK